MGIVKKLKGEELVGWEGSPTTDVYPITSTSAVFDSSNRSLDEIIQSLGDTGDTDNVTNLWAWAAAPNDVAALAKLDLYERVNIPTGWQLSASVTLAANEYLYLTTARKKKDNFIPWDDGTIWSTPVKMGGTSTSTTGADGQGINYIYCRTKDNTAPVVPGRPDLVLIVEAVGPNLGIDFSGNITSQVFNAWYDHPLGVEKAYPYEWCLVYKGNDSEGWVKSTAPVIWSKYGLDGRDGDGVEYIYKLVAKGETPPTSFNGTYTGTVGGKGTIYININKTDINYQKDDFIPSGWTDNPLTISEAFPDLYVSVRKKEWETIEEQSKYGDFSIPTLWSHYGDKGLPGDGAGPLGCIIRLTEWDPRVTYINQSELDPSNIHEIRYIDVVYRSANDKWYMATTASNNVGKDPYLGNSTYWTEITEGTPTRTPLIIADNAVIKLALGNEFYLMDSNQKIVGGMQGFGNHSGDYIYVQLPYGTNNITVQCTRDKSYDSGNYYAWIPPTETNGATLDSNYTTIFSLVSIPDGSTILYNKNKTAITLKSLGYNSIRFFAGVLDTETSLDPSKAPFRVYESGKVVSSLFTLATPKSATLDISNPNEVLWLTTYGLAKQAVANAKGISASEVIIQGASVTLSEDMPIMLVRWNNSFFVLNPLQLGKSGAPAVSWYLIVNNYNYDSSTWVPNTIGATSFYKSLSDKKYYTDYNTTSPLNNIFIIQSRQGIDCTIGVPFGGGSACIAVQAKKYPIYHFVNGWTTNTNGTVVMGNPASTDPIPCGHIICSNYIDTNSGKYTESRSKVFVTSMESISGRTFYRGYYKDDNGNTNTPMSGEAVQNIIGVINTYTSSGSIPTIII